MPADYRKTLLYLPLAALLMGAAGGGWIGVLVARSGGPVEAPHDHGENNPFEARRREKLGLFEVSHAARDTLDLRVAPAAVGEMTETVLLPAMVRELPAVSELDVAARIEGVVRRVFVRRGQAIREGDPLCELDLTGDALAATQSALLLAVQQLQIAGQEIARLEKLAASGGVAGQRLLELQYDQRRHQAELETKRQELVVRGLSPEQVERMIEQRQLVRSTVLRVPAGLVDDRPLPPGEAASAEREESAQPPADDRWSYSVEELMISPGRLVSIGDTIVNLAYHAELVVEGQAFDRDVDLIRAAMAEGRKLTVLLGPDDDPVRLEDLELSYVDSHLDPETKSYRLYLRLPNEVVQERTNGPRRYRMWRFNPGQRGHVLLPGRRWTGEIPLPAEAVVRDGVDWYAFRQAASNPRATPPHDDFAPLRVTVLHEEPHRVLVAAETLPAGTPIAMNQAYRLLLAMKDAQSEGAAHPHGHDH